MATRHKYCQRCHEEHDGDSISCDACGVEMCGSCATRLEIDTETCARCRGKVEAHERRTELQARIPKILPCMRKWYEQNVVNQAR